MAYRSNKPGIPAKDSTARSAQATRRRRRRLTSSPRSMLKNAGKMLANGKIPIAAGNRRKYLLVEGVETLTEGGYVNLGKTQNSALQAHAILNAYGMVPVNNFTDEQRGANYSLLIEQGKPTFEKITEEDLDVYGNIIGADDRGILDNNLLTINSSMLKQVSMPIPGNKKDNDPIFNPDMNLTEQEKIFFEQIQNKKDLSSDNFINIELAIEATEANSMCEDLVKIPGGAPLFNKAPNDYPLESN